MSPTDFEVLGPGQLGVGDITHVAIGTGLVCLAIIPDGWSRKIGELRAGPHHRRATDSGRAPGCNRFPTPAAGLRFSICQCPNHADIDLQAIGFGGGGLLCLGRRKRPRFRHDRGCLLDGPFLDLQIRLQLDRSCLDLFVAAPESDHRGVDFGAQKTHGGGMSQHMLGHPLVCVGRARNGRVRDVSGQSALDRIAFDGCGMFGMAQRGVAEQGPDRGQPDVSGAHVVLALVLQMVEESADQRRIEIVYGALSCRCPHRSRHGRGRSTRMTVAASGPIKVREVACTCDSRRIAVARIRSATYCGVWR